MNDVEQREHLEGLQLKQAAQSEAGQLYHKLVMQLMDEHVMALACMGPDKSDSDIIRLVRQMQGMYQCLGREGHEVAKAYGFGQRLAKQALS